MYKVVELTLKRPFIQLEVQVLNLPIDVYFSNSANEVQQHLHLRTTAVRHRSQILVGYKHHLRYF